MTDMPLPSLLQPELTAALRAHLLPQLTIADLIRLSCCCSNLRELVLSASDVIWQVAATKELPLWHPPVPESRTAAQSAMQTHTTRVSNLKAGRYHVQGPMLMSLLDSNTLTPRQAAWEVSPDASVLACVAHPTVDSLEHAELTFVDIPDGSRSVVVLEGGAWHSIHWLPGRGRVVLLRGCNPHRGQVSVMWQQRKHLLSSQPYTLQVYSHPSGHHMHTQIVGGVEPGFQLASWLWSPCGHRVLLLFLRPSDSAWQMRVEDYVQSSSVPLVFDYKDRPQVPPPLTRLMAGYQREVVGSVWGSLVCWDVRSGVILKVIPNLHKWTGDELQHTPPGGPVRLWLHPENFMQTWSQPVSRQLPQAELYHAAVSPDDRRLAAMTHHDIDKLYIADRVAPAAVCQMPIGHDWPYCRKRMSWLDLRWAPDSRWICFIGRPPTCPQRGQLCIADTVTGHVLQLSCMVEGADVLSKLRAGQTGMQWSPCGSRLCLLLPLPQLHETPAHISLFHVRFDKPQQLAFSRSRLPNE